MHKDGPELLLVTQKSATSVGLTAVSKEDNVHLETDHSNLVKYNSMDHGAYTVVSERLSTLVSPKALENVKIRQNGT